MKSFLGYNEKEVVSFVSREYSQLCQRLLSIAPLFHNEGKEALVAEMQFTEKEKYFIKYKAYWCESCFLFRYDIEDYWNASKEIPFKFDPKRLYELKSLPQQIQDDFYQNLSYIIQQWWKQIGKPEHQKVNLYKNSIDQIQSANEFLDEEMKKL